MLKLWLLYLKQKNICSFWIWFLRASEKTKHDIFCIVLSWCVNCFQWVTGVESRQVSLVPRLFYCASMLMKYAQNILTLSCWIKEMAVPSLSLSLLKFAFCPISFCSLLLSPSHGGQMWAWFCWRFLLPEGVCPSHCRQVLAHRELCGWDFFLILLSYNMKYIYIYI